ncbi:phage tail protein [Streptomyces sp. NPDC055085]
MPVFDSLALTNRFSVVLDGDINLGYWSSVRGLDVTWNLCEYRSGDAANSRLFYPGSTKYSDIQLSRAACADSQTVQAWLSSCSISTQKWSGTIYLADSDQQAVISWNLYNLMPLSWKLETPLDASQSKVAIENLTLAHEGFLNDYKDMNQTLLTPDQVQDSSYAQGFGDTSNQQAGSGLTQG